MASINKSSSEGSEVERLAKAMLTEDLAGTETGQRVRWDSLSFDTLGRALQNIYLQRAEEEIQRGDQ